MVSFNKKSFFVPFVLCFSGALILLGVVQATLGTMRLYNASEQTYENLAPKKTFTTDINTQNAAPKTSEKENSEDIIFYLVENKQIIENAIKEMPPEKAQKVEEKIQTIENTYQKTVIVPVKENAGDTKNTSPVEISVTPEESSAPK